jgi:N-acetylmuramoyl-L-alanine amidase
MLIIVLGRKKLRLCLTLVGFVLLVAAGFFYSCHQSVLGRLGRLTVIIDPGHGGVDGGAGDNRGNLEKEVNLQIGLKIRQQLRQSGLNAIMTRETDTDLAPFHSGKGGRHRRDLLRRIEIARQNKALFFVSIHCDSSTATRKQGAFVFFNWRSAISKGLAAAIQDEINQVQAKPGRIAPGKYLVIRQSGVTGVLVEVGYLSNREEAALLQKPSYRERLGLAISRGILQFCREFVR